MRILVADDHALFRDILSEYIKKAAPEADVLIAASLTEAVDILEEKNQEIDLVVLDILMPGMSGLQGITLVKHKFPKTKVAIISGTIESDKAKEAMELGAVGYFPKTLSAASFIPAIRLVLSGQQYLPTDLSAPGRIMRSYYGNKDTDATTPSRMASYAVHEQAAAWNSNDPEATKLSSLSRREKEILELVSKGLKNKEIGDQLGIEESTVKQHMRKIFEKLGVRNRTEAGNMLK